MTLPLEEPLPLPWRTDEEGRLRVGNSRITLEDLWHHFEEGRTPESIVEQLPTVSLANVYLVKAFCLLHEEEVREHMRRYEAEAARIRANHEDASRALQRKVYERQRARLAN